MTDHAALQRAVCVLIAAATPLAGQLQPAVRRFDSLAFQAPELSPATETVAYAPHLASAAVAAPWERFAAAAGGWHGTLDPRSGLLVSAEGQGIPWVAGSGNTLPAVPGGATLAMLEARAKALLGDLGPALGLTADDELHLAVGRSGALTDQLWAVDYDVVRRGLPIDGARIVFRVGHGNLIQLGAEGLPNPETATPAPTLGRDDARAVVGAYLGGWRDDDFREPGRLSLVPVRIPDAARDAGFVPGAGRGLAAVWTFVFRRQGEPGTWQARVDAVSGQMLALTNLNRDGDVVGGAYRLSPTLGAQVSLPVPFADVGVGVYADSAGHHNQSGFTTKLDGRYVKITDTCGAISQAPDWKGDVDLGISPGTDCSTPGFGGNGNTAAARTQYYHVNRAKEAARAWLPANAWLQTKLTVNVNLNQTCNAYWNGSSLNLFKSGNGCGNTGEIAAVALHELGHGIDSNDGNGTAGDPGSGETYGDITAALALHDSCIGPGFRATNCSGNGDACLACTGVRDIDWDKHNSHAAHTVDNFTRPLCPLPNPNNPGYVGPCGNKEGHCESYVSSEAVWDFANRDLPSPGSAGAWAVAERLWYLSRSTASNAFSCTVGATYTSNGCNTGSLWKVLRAADDDDGNLANGTPHSCNLYAAFDRHGIACTSDAGANTCFSTCTPPATPSLSATPGALQVGLGWTDLGAGKTYDIYRSELSCDSGMIRIVNDQATATYTDTVVAPGLTYYYQVVAQPTGNEGCAAAPSSCQSATPTAPPCTPPDAPGSVLASATGLDEVTVSWATVSGADGYNVYRGPAPGGPFTLVKTTTSLAYVDRYLAPGASYSYVVRAYTGTCESADSAPSSATLATCATTTLWSETFASAPSPAWEVGRIGGTGTNEWRGQQTCGADAIFRYGGTTCTGDYSNSQHVFTAGPLTAIPAGVAAVRLNVVHRWAFETDWDGGRLAMRVGANPTLVYADSSAIVSGTNYNGSLKTGVPSAPPTGTPIFTNTQATNVTTVVDLDRLCDTATAGTTGCDGLLVQPAFAALTDTSQTGDGWFLDSVAITACVSSAPTLPSDGFESGDLAGWSAFTP